MEFAPEDSIAEFRRQYGITLHVTPPYQHHKNHEAEHAIHANTMHCRTRLRALLKEQIGGCRIPDPAGYWPYAWQHSAQCYNELPNVTLEKRWQIVCTPWQKFTGDHSLDNGQMRMHPFGEPAWSLIEKDNRNGKLNAVRERCLYLINGHINPLVNKHSHMPEASVMLFCTKGNIKTTNKLYFPYLSFDTEHLTDVEEMCRPFMEEPKFDAQPMHQSDTTRVVPRSDPQYQTVADDIGYDPKDQTVDAPEPEHVPRQTEVPRPKDIVLPTPFYRGDVPLTKCTGVPNPEETDIEPWDPDRHHDPFKDCDPVGPLGDVPTGETDGEAPKDAHRRSSRTSRPPKRFTADHGADSKWSSNYCVNGVWKAYNLALPSVYDMCIERVAITFPKSNNKFGDLACDPKGTLSRSRFRKYSEAHNVQEYFQLGGTLTDFRNDLVRGKFVFVDPHLHSLQYSRGAHWQKLYFGGEHDPLVAQKPPGSNIEAQSRQTTSTVDNATRLMQDKINAKTLGMTHEAYHTVTHHREALLHFSGGPTERLYGSSCDLDEQLKDYLGLALFKDCWSDEYMDHLEEDVLPNLPEIWLNLYTVTPNDIVIDEHKLTDLKTVPEEQRPAMIEAIYKELRDLCRIGAFELGPCNKRPITSRIVLKVKYRADGSYDRHKARLVARGFLAKVGVEFFSTFSPMASLTSVRAIISMAVNKGYDIWHCDIPAAFIQSDIDSDTFLELPKYMGVRYQGKISRVVKLRRALYGLKQSPQLWNKAITAFFCDKCGMTRATSETSLFYRRTPKGHLLVLTEVDDMVITGTPALIQELKVKLEKEYKITQFEELSSFLGINIEHNKQTGILSMDVKAKIDAMFDERPQLNGLGHSSKPMDETVNLTRKSDDKCKYIKYLQNPTVYASVVGSCIYLAITCRPDISHAVGRCSRGMHAPTQANILQLKTLLKYLRGSAHYKLNYYRDNHPLKDTLN